FRLSAVHALRKPYRSGEMGIRAEAFEPAFAEAAGTPSPLSPAAARAFFERHFMPFLVVPEDAARGFVTGFYEPRVPASPVRAPEFPVPLLAVPDDLVKIGDDDRPWGLDPYLAFGRR